MTSKTELAEWIEKALTNPQVVEDSLPWKRTLELIPGEELIECHLRAHPAYDPTMHRVEANVLQLALIGKHDNDLGAAVSAYQALRQCTTFFKCCSQLLDIPADLCELLFIWHDELMLPGSAAIIAQKLRRDEI